MVGDRAPLAPALTRLQPALTQQLGQELGVVDHLVVAPHLGILVGEGVEAMGTLRDHLAHPQVGKGLDVRERQLLPDVLVARPPGGISVAQLAATEDGERDPGPAQEPGECHRHRRVAVVEGARAAHEPQVLDLADPVLTQDRDLEVEPARPIRPLLLTQSPGVALVLHRHEGLPQLGGEVRLHQREVAAHVEDAVEDLDPHRADLIARLAGGARPRLLGLHPLEEVGAVDGDPIVERHRR